MHTLICPSVLHSRRCSGMHITECCARAPILHSSLLELQGRGGEQGRARRQSGCGRGVGAPRAYPCREMRRVWAWRARPRAGPSVIRWEASVSRSDTEQTGPEAGATRQGPLFLPGDPWTCFSVPVLSITLSLPRERGKQRAELKGTCRCSSSILELLCLRSEA